MPENHLHQGQAVLTAGKSLSNAHAAMILVHGRGASAESILTLTNELGHEEFTYLAPQAANAAWYPYSFLAPTENNEPWLSSALQALAETLRKVQQAGIPTERTFLLGFSQGACLTLEFAARHARRFGGIIALSGGLIGPPGTNFSYPGSLEKTPVFLGCSDIDPHIPVERVYESTQAMQELSADVTERIYPGMAHTINQDELTQVRKMMSQTENEMIRS